MNTRETQTVKICTEENIRKQYARYYRISAPFALSKADIQARLAGLMTIADLEKWLVEDRHATREQHHEVGGSMERAARTDFRIVDPHQPSYSPTEDPWVLSARAVVEQSINDLLHEFLLRPYLHRCEHSLHVRLCELLKSHELLAPVVPLGSYGEMTQLVHKEWPETLSRSGKSKRGNFDIAILPPKLLAACPTLAHFESGELPAPIVIEMGLNYSGKHFRDDAMKLINSRPQHGYLVHLLRGRPRDAPTEDLILDGQTRPGIQTAYAWVGFRKTAVKRLEEREIVVTSA